MSSTERPAYAADVIASLHVRLDQSRLPLRLVSATFPDVAAFRTGDGAIQLQVDASHAALAGGAHQLFLKNGHRPQQSVYLANALVPDNARVAVTDQQRDGAQSELTIRYLVDATQAGLSPAWLFVVVPAAAVALAIRHVAALPLRPGTGVESSHLAHLRGSPQ